MNSETAAPVTHRGLRLGHGVAEQAARLRLRHCQPRAVILKASLRLLLQAAEEPGPPLTLLQLLLRAAGSFGDQVRQLVQLAVEGSQLTFQIVHALTRIHQLGLLVLETLAEPRAQALLRAVGGDVAQQQHGLAAVLCLVQDIRRLVLLHLQVDGVARGWG